MYVFRYAHMYIFIHISLIHIHTHSINLEDHLQLPSYTQKNSYTYINIYHQTCICIRTYMYIYICLYCQCPFKKIQVNFRVTRSRKKLLNHQRFTFEFCRIFFVHFILVQLRPVLPQKGCKVFFRTKCEVFLLKACCQMKNILKTTAPLNRNPTRTDALTPLAPLAPFSLSQGSHGALLQF